jgi:hypothetical protein
MSKNRKERKVSTLQQLSTVVDVESLPVAEEMPAETSTKDVRQETAETLENELREYISQEDIDEAKESGAFDDVVDTSMGAENNHGQDVPNEPPVAPAEEPPATNITKEALELIEALQAQINLLKTSKASRKVASGSKARPNVTYTLLAKPPAWHSTPQVAQLQQILFDAKFLDAHRGEDGTVKVSEPELFAQVIAGKEAGVLRTHQEAVRIFQYYRSILLNSNCLRWQ